MDNGTEQSINDALYKYHDRIKAAKFDKEQLQLVLDICAHIGELNEEISRYKRQLNDVGPSADVQNTKKRKLDDAGSTTQATTSVRTKATHTASSTAWSEEPSFEVRDISFVMPQRKKLKIGIRPGTSAEDGGIMVESMQGKDEDSLRVKWIDIEHIICTTVPEKATPAYNFIIIPSAASQQRRTSPLEPIIFTVPTAPAKDVRFHDGDQLQEKETWDQLFQRVLNAQLRRFRKKVIIPERQEFESGLVQAHRKGEKAYHVKAFRGASEGFIFFLSTGILFGFRKPVLFFPFHSITSISYSSVLQRTFNLNISVQLRADDSTFFIKGAPSAGQAPTNVEYEFSMVDQADHSGIDRYVKGHGLNDASLAEGRRAKRINVNKERSNGVVSNGGSGHPEAEIEEEESELAKAERELQDAEDEEEEDYEDEGGESGGSGSDSEEEEDADVNDDEEGDEEAEATD